METEKARLSREYVWSRLTFNFQERFRIFRAALTWGTVVLIGQIVLNIFGASGWLTAPLGGFLVISTILFYLLDRHFQASIVKSEAALRSLETENPPADFPGRENICSYARHSWVIGVFYGLIGVEGIYFATLPFFLPKAQPPPPASIAVAAVTPDLNLAPTPRARPNFPYQPGGGFPHSNVPGMPPYTFVPGTPVPLPTRTTPVRPAGTPPPPDTPTTSKTLPGAVTPSPATPSGPESSPASPPPRRTP